MEEGRTRRGGSSKWKIVKELLTLKALACCGSLWGSSRGHSNHMTLTEDEYTSNIDDVDDDDDDNSYHYSHESEQRLVQSRDPHCLPHRRMQTNAADQEMNLASALQAERQFRAAAAAAETGPMKMSLMRLLEAKEREERERMSEVEEGEGMGVCCCVCMGSKKGAAFIPCGHTFCRVCARELWLNRGACPLCNRSILEILDIF